MEIKEEGKEVEDEQKKSQLFLMEGGLSKRGGIGKKKSGDLNSGQSTYI